MSTLISRCAPVAAVLALAVFGSAAQAATLSLTQIYPDVTSSGMAISYDPVSHVFSATGGVATKLSITPTANVPVGNPFTITGGTFTLTALISNTGTVLPGGTLSITGTDTSPGHVGPQVYFQSANLLNFGFSQIGVGGVPEEFDFMFSPGLGDYGLPFIGVKLFSNLNGYVAANPFAVASGGFNNTGLTNTAVADALSTPLPSSALMGLSAIGALPLFLRRRKS